LGGQIDLFFATPQSVVQQVATGALKAYGVTSKEKLRKFPCGKFSRGIRSKLDVVYWQAMFAPAGTPEAVIDTLNGALQKAVADPAIVEAWAAQTSPSSPQDNVRRRRLTRWLRSEIARWAR